MKIFAVKITFTRADWQVEGYDKASDHFWKLFAIAPKKRRGPVMRNTHVSK
jgi:hypothetical protein